MQNNIIVFYSWQNDIDPKQHRFFIRNALDKSIKASCFQDKKIQIDESTLNTPGSPEIASTILEKIINSSIFVCDITPITTFKDKKLITNPNVMLELGYAAHALSWNNIICIANSDTIKGEMPFDIKTRRHVLYSPSAEDGENILKGKIIHALRCIIEHDSFVNRKVLIAKKREQDLKIILEALKEFNFRCFDNFAESISQGKIPSDILLYWEGFSREVSSSRFILEHKQLQNEFTNLCQFWGKALSYTGEMHWDVIDNYYVATKPINTKYMESSIEMINTAYNHVKKISQILHEDFKEIDITETDKISFERMAPYRN